MPPVSKVNDLGLVPADSHGCTSCPHTCTGPAITGSQDTITNGQPTLRIGDMGIHAACCGPNIFITAQGSSTVTVNDIPVCRLGDLTAHCGGVGCLVTGSGNVNVGG